MHHFTTQRGNRYANCTKFDQVVRFTTNYLLCHTVFMLCVECEKLEIKEQGRFEFEVGTRLFLHRLNTQFYRFISYRKELFFN